MEYKKMLENFIEEGIIDSYDLVEMFMRWTPESEVKEMCLGNDITKESYEV